MPFIFQLHDHDLNNKLYGCSHYDPFSIKIKNLLGIIPNKQSYR